jgi:L-lysine 2,3-aminomutase
LRRHPKIRACIMSGGNCFLDKEKILIFLQARRMTWQII